MDYYTQTSCGPGRASGVGPDRTQPHPSEHAGPAACQTDRSALGDHDSFGSGDGQGERLERADVIDPDAQEKHSDLMSGSGEIGEDAPNEANFDETTSSV